MDLDRAERWTSRWDAQQEWYMPDREERFTVLIDAVEAGAGRDDPLVLDLGCGPGSLAVRLLDRMPAARVVAIDTDPLLLALGRAVYGGRSGLRFVDQDLRKPGWAAALGLDRPADAAVSTTALHWLDAARLRAMYAELATALRPGGLMLDGDHLKEDEAAVPALARLGDAVSERAARRRLGDREQPGRLEGLVGSGDRRSGTGRSCRRAGAAQAQRGPSRLGVGAADPARRGAARGRVRRDRHALAVRREPHPLRRHPHLSIPGLPAAAGLAMREWPTLASPAVRRHGV